MVCVPATTGEQSPSFASAYVKQLYRDQSPYEHNLALHRTHTAFTHCIH